MITRAAFEKMAQMAEARDIAEYVQKVDKQKRKKKLEGTGGLGLAAGLLGGGLAAKKFSDYVLTPEDAKVVDDLIALRSKVGGPLPPNSLQSLFLPNYSDSPEYQHSPSLMYDYVERAARAARVSVMGTPVGPTVKAIEDKVWQPGADATMSVHEAQNHYPSFLAGPVPAYLHQIRKVAYESRDNGRNIEQLTQTMWGGRPDLQVDADGKMVDPLDFTKKVDERFKQYMREAHKVDVDPTSNEQMSKIPFPDQVDQMRGFKGWLSAKEDAERANSPTNEPKLSDRLDTVERNYSAWQTWAAGNYANAIGIPKTMMYDLPRFAGYAAMAAGAGLGGYWLYKKLKKRYGTPEREQPVARPEALEALA